LCILISYDEKTGNSPIGFHRLFAACKKSGDGGGSKTFTGCELIKVVDSSNAKGINIKPPLATTSMAIL